MDEQTAPAPESANITDILGESIRADREQRAAETSPAAPQDGEAPQEPTPAQKRALRILASEIELPDTIDDETYSRLEKVTSEINRGVDSKFKEAAQIRQQVEAQRQQLAAEAENARQFVMQHREIAALAHEVGQYENVDWDAALAQAQDEETRNRLRDLRYSVDAKRGKLGNMVAAVRAQQEREQAEAAQRAQTTQAHLAEMLTRNGEQFIRQRIPDWGPEAQKRTIEAMSEYGVGKTVPALDEMAQFVARFHPAVTAAFHDAALYRAGLKKAEADSRQEAPVPKPAGKVGGNAVSAAKDPDKMTTEEWLRWRNAQIRSRAA